jgi:hypothetical protein
VLDQRLELGDETLRAVRVEGKRGRLGKGGAGKQVRIAPYDVEADPGAAAAAD